MPSALKQGQCLELGWSIPVAAWQQQRLWLLVLKSPPTQPQERLEGFTYLSWLFLVLEYLFFPFLFLSSVCVILFLSSFLNICICWTFAYFFKSPFPFKAEKYIWFMCIVYKAKRKKKEKKAKKYREKEKNILIYFGLIFGISFKVFFFVLWTFFCQRPWCVSVCLSYRKYLKCKHGCFVMPPCTRIAAAFHWV